MKAEKIRDAMETAHDKEMEMIDRKADEARVAADEAHEAKLRAFDKVVAAFRAKRQAVDEKAGEVSEAVSRTATDLTEAVGMKASDLGAKAGEIKEKTAKGMRDRSWLAPMVGVVLLLALALSVSKKMRSEAA